MHRLNPKLAPSRQRWLVPSPDGSDPNPSKGVGYSSSQLKVLSNDGATLSEAGVRDGGVLVFKDLGPQIGYQTVFFWEYLGPLVIYLLVYMLPSGLLYGREYEVGNTMSFFSRVADPLPKASATRSVTQTLACAYWTFHYAKRIYETFNVHKFSHATMPLFNLVKNCTYYWLFALYVAYFVNHPLYTAPGLGQTVVCLGLAMVCQYANYRCHVILASLRGPGVTGYVVPRGFLFEWVTCPNYSAEIAGWVLFTIATQTAAAGLFALVGAGQMLQWALSKGRRLRRLFRGEDGGERYRVRYVLVPGVI